MKKSKKFLAVLSTSAMLATVGAPAVLPGVASSTAFAAGAGSLTAATVPTVKDGLSTPQALGTIQISIPQYTVTPGNDNNTVTVKLPQGVTIKDPEAGQINGTSVTGRTLTFGAPGNTLTVAQDGYSDNNTAAFSDVIQYVKVLGDDQIQIKLNPDFQNLKDDTILNLNFGAVIVSGATSGPLDVTFDAPSQSVFPTGTVTAANVNSSGKVDLSVLDTKTANDNFTFTLRMKEEVAGSFQKSSNSLKFKLPAGYKWDSNPVQSADVLYGDPLVVGTDYTATVDGQNLTVAFNKTTSQATEIQLKLGFHVDDDSIVQPGDIIATITGTSDTNVSQAPVGTYGDYSASVSVESTPDVIAGKDQQKIGNIVLKESIGGTLVKDRTVTLTLPDGARWQSDFEKKGNTDSSDIPGAGFDSDQGLSLEFVGYTDSNHTTAKFKVSGTSSSNAKTAPTITLKNAEVAIDPTFTGDLNVEVGGTAGVTGTVTVAKVQAPFTASVSQTPNLTIGSAGQALGDITITENVAGAFSKNSGAQVYDANGNKPNNIAVLHLPSGVTWDGTPTVKVTSGNLSISNITTNDSDLSFTVDGESTTPSTITITNAKVKVDRTVAYGPVSLKIKGDAAAMTSRFVSAWSDRDYALKFDVAKVATPAPGETAGKAVFTVGSTSYTVDGQQMTADVAPYIKNNRTYLPVTYVAQALGVSLQNIVWNNADRTVTIFNGGRIVQMKIGSKQLTVNGVQYTMDTAPEISNSRTMLPIAYLATALGVPYNWDATTQTVTFGN